MNRMIKACAAGLAVLFVGSAVIFAAPRDGYHDRRPEPQMRGEPKGERREGPRQMREQETKAPREQLLMGTVKSADTENGLIVVTDADGNDKNVHVNPLTKIGFIFPQPPMPQPQEQPPEQGDKEAQEQGGFCPPPRCPRPDVPPIPPMARFEDIKEGTFVVVIKFETGTETIEAALIKVVPPKPEGEDKPKEPADSDAKSEEDAAAKAE